MAVSQMNKERTGGFNLCHCETGRFRIPSLQQRWIGRKTGCGETQGANINDGQFCFMYKHKRLLF